MFSAQDPAGLEEQFILRLPAKEAKKVHKLLDRKPGKIKKALKIDMDHNMVHVGKRQLHTVLHRFPTIIESYKTNIVNDKSNIYKTADICHMLECVEEPVETSRKESIHGYTAPLKNVKKKRFRSTLVNPEVAETTEMVTKELYYLLSTDMEAVSTRFELIEQTENKGEKKGFVWLCNSFCCRKHNWKCIKQ